MPDFYETLRGIAEDVTIPKNIMPLDLTQPISSDDDRLSVDQICSGFPLRGIF